MSDPMKSFEEWANDNLAGLQINDGESDLIQAARAGWNAAATECYLAVELASYHTIDTYSGTLSAKKTTRRAVILDDAIDAIQAVRGAKEPNHV